MENQIEKLPKFNFQSQEEPKKKKGQNVQNNEKAIKTTVVHSIKCQNTRKMMKKLFKYNLTVEKKTRKTPKHL